MQFKVGTYDEDGYPSANFHITIGKSEQSFARKYNEKEDRAKHIEQTRYIFLQRGLEYVYRAIKEAKKDLPFFYGGLQDDLDKVIEMIAKYEPGTSPKEFISMITSNSEVFYRLVPPKDYHYYQAYKSRITAFVMYCEMN